MQRSKYNILIPHKNAIIVYNTLWNTMIAIKKEKLTEWGLNESIPFVESKISPNVINILVGKKMIIDDSVNELSFIKSKLNETNNDNSKITIIIIPTLGCNFNCWYCYEDHSKPSFMNDTDNIRIIALIKRIISDNKELKMVNIQFFGGEPMLRYKKTIKPLLTSIKPLFETANIAMFVSFTTNGYFFTNRNLEFLTSYNLKTLQITIDGNKVRHNDVRFSYKGEDTYNIIIHNVKAALKFGIYVSIRINLSKETNLNVENLISDFSDIPADRKKHLRFSIHKVWQAPSEVESTVIDVVKSIRKNGFNCASFYSEPGSIWNSCYSDKKSTIIINPNGTLFKCTARDFNKQQIEGHLHKSGSISWLPEHYTRENISPFDNKECTNCPIFPICVGGCSQKRRESTNNDKCILHMSHEDKIEHAKKILSEKLIKNDSPHLFTSN